MENKMNEENRRKSSHKSSRSPPKSKPQSASDKKSRADSNKRLSSKSPKRKSMPASHESLASMRTVHGANEPIKSSAEYEDMSGQGLTNLNPKLFQKTTLRKLILSGNNLRSLPAAIADLINLEFIDLSKNPLRVKDVDDSNCLPLEMRFLKNLKHLSLRECNLRAIPTTVWLCQSLRYLDLSRNKLGLLVPDIGNLINLVWLNLVQCNLSSLPSEMSFCSQLVEIDLMSNNIESLPETLRDLRSLETLRMSFSAFTALLDSYMEQLISKNQIKSEHIPVVVFELESLLELDLKRTKINNLPENNFQKLQRLYLDHNYFEDLLETNLRATEHTLTELTLSHNILKHIPDEVYYLRTLRLLDLSHNRIASITRPLHMPHLQKLYLSANKLTRLDSSLGDGENNNGLANLEELTLDRNELVHIDDSIYDLLQLRYLDLSYNKLTHLSPKLAALMRLESAHLYDKFAKKGLWVIGNPLEIPHKEIWQTSNVNKIGSFLSSYEQRNLEFVYYAQLIFIPTHPRLSLQLVDLIFAQKFHPDYDALNRKNKVVRRFYKRTENKCEFSVLDVSDIETVGSLFLAHVDFQVEPVIVLLVFDAAAYTTESHADHLGKLIENVLVRARSQVRLRFIGIGKLENASEQEVLENANRTIKEYYERIKNELARIDSHSSVSEMSSLLDENKSYLRLAKSKLKELLSKSISSLGEAIFCLESFDSDSLKRCLNYLETEAIALKKTASLGQRSYVRERLHKLELTRTNRADRDEVLASLGANNNNNFDNMNDMIYAKTLNELIWLQFDEKLNQHLYLRFDYMLNLINKFMRLDLKTHLNIKSIVFDKSIDSFESKLDAQKSIALFRKYGQCEQKLLKYIYYESDINELGRNQTPIADSLELLERFGFMYRSECEYIEHKTRSYFQAVFPLACSSSYSEIAQKRVPTPSMSSSSSDIRTNSSFASWEDCLYTNEFELYFIRLDHIRRYWTECKELNALRKEKMLWASRVGPPDNEFYNYFECDLSTGSGSMLTDEELYLKQIEHNIYDADGNLSFQDEQKLIEEYKNNGCSVVIDVDSPVLSIPRCFFARFAIAMQPLLFERFDWSDALVGRDVNDTCVRARLLGTANRRNSKLNIEIKSKQIDAMNEMKRGVLEALSMLKIYYPGLYYLIKINN